MPTAADAELLRALLADLDAIIERLVAKIRAEIESFSLIPIAEQQFAAGASVRPLILELLGEAEGHPAHEAVAGLGERRAEQGVPVEEVLRAWRIGVDHVIAEARAIAERDGYRPETAFDLFQSGCAVRSEPRLLVDRTLEPDGAEVRASRCVRRFPLAA